MVALGRCISIYSFKITKELLKIKNMVLVEALPNRNYKHFCEITSLDHLLPSTPHLNRYHLKNLGVVREMMKYVNFFFNVTLHQSRFIIFESLIALLVL